MNKLKLLLGLAASALLASLAFLYSGLYNIGADDQHLRPVYWALETLRERSIAVRAGQIDVPALDDPQMLLAGGADYNDMCSGCHLKPGKASSDISSGLYPRPPIWPCRHRSMAMGTPVEVMRTGISKQARRVSSGSSSTGSKRAAWLHSDRATTTPGYGRWSPSCRSYRAWMQRNTRF